MSLDHEDWNSEERKKLQALAQQELIFAGDATTQVEQTKDPFIFTMKGRNRQCLICGVMHDRAPGYLLVLPNGFLYGCYHAKAHFKPHTILHCSKIRRVISFVPEWLTREEFDKFLFIDHEIFLKIQNRAMSESGKFHLDTVKMFDGKEISEDYKQQKQLASRVMAAYDAVTNAFFVRLKASKGVHVFQKTYEINQFKNRVWVWTPQSQQDFKNDTKFAVFVPHLETKKPEKAKKPLGRPPKRRRTEETPAPAPVPWKYPLQKRNLSPS